MRAPRRSSRFRPTLGDHKGRATAWATDCLQQALVTQAYVVTLRSGIKHVDSHTQEASGLATIASPTQPNYTTAARAPAIAEQLTTAAVQFGGSAERDRLEVTKTQSPEMLERRFFLLEQHVRFVRDRLKRAGTRLARLLNTTLRQ